jgi:hypothetical protein
VEELTINIFTQAKLHKTILKFKGERGLVGPIGAFDWKI